MASFWYQNIQNKYQQQKNIPGDPFCPYNRFAPPYSMNMQNVTGGWGDGGGVGGR